MKKEATPTASESSQQVASETNKQSSSNPKQLIEQHPIQDTPFTAVKWSDTSGDQWIVALGQFRLSGPLPTKEAAAAYAQSPTWELIMAVINALIVDHEMQKQLKATIEKQQTQKNDERLNGSMKTF